MKFQKNRRAKLFNIGSDSRLDKGMRGCHLVECTGRDVSSKQGGVPVGRIYSHPHAFCSFAFVHKLIKLSCGRHADDVWTNIRENRFLFGLKMITLDSFVQQHGSGAESQRGNRVQYLLLVLWKSEIVEQKAYYRLHSCRNSQRFCVNHSWNDFEISSKLLRI